MSNSDSEADLIRTITKERDERRKYVQTVDFKNMSNDEVLKQMMLHMKDSEWNVNNSVEKYYFTKLVRECASRKLLNDELMQFNLLSTDYCRGNFKKHGFIILTLARYMRPVSSNILSRLHFSDNYGTIIHAIDELIYNGANPNVNFMGDEHSLVVYLSSKLLKNVWDYGNYFSEDIHGAILECLITLFRYGVNWNEYVRRCLYSSEISILTNMLYEAKRYYSPKLRVFYDAFNGTVPASRFLKRDGDTRCMHSVGAFLGSGIDFNVDDVMTLCLYTHF